MARRVGLALLLLFSPAWSFAEESEDWQDPSLQQAPQQGARPFQEQAGISGEAISSIEEEDFLDEKEEKRPGFNLLYYSVFYGPALQGPSRFQPSRSGAPDRDRPVQMRNFLGASWNLSESVSVIPTAYFIWEADERKFSIRDPFLRISHNSLINTDRVNLYADLRFHFPVTTISRQNDLLAGVQSFQSLSWQPGGSPVAFTLFGSVRYNYFGRQGYGNDLEVYLAPYMAYQLRHNLALTLLYEMEGSHFFGDAPGAFRNHGPDLEPGISWEVTPSFVINPYLNIFPHDSFSLRTMSLGMTMFWAVF
ncbi:MAG: hypothetical protein NDJ89_15250 [Oligoflexia bacterium]|nr:hypothetical protein [Oligoflexia bacterium]